MTRDTSTGRFSVKDGDAWLRGAVDAKLGRRSFRTDVGDRQSTGGRWLRDRITDAQVGPASLGEAPPAGADPPSTADSAAAAGGLGGGPAVVVPRGENLDESIRRQVFGG